MNRFGITLLSLGALAAIVYLAAHVGRPRAWTNDAITFAALAVLLAVALVALWLLPKRQAEKLNLASSKDRFQCEDAARKTVAQVMGGILLLAGVYSTQNTLANSNETLRVSKETELAERFFKATEQLGSGEKATAKTDHNGKEAMSGPDENLPARVGAVYAMQRLAEESEDYYWPVMETLTTYVRVRAPNAIVPTPDCQNDPDRPFLPPSAEIQAILEVVGTRKRAHDNGRPLDLRCTNLRKAVFEDLDFVGIKFDGANLSGANFRRSHLCAASLNGAVLLAANFTDADLRHTNLDGIDLSHVCPGCLTQPQVNVADGDSKTILPQELHAPNRWIEDENKNIKHGSMAVHCD